MPEGTEEEGSVMGDIAWVVEHGHTVERPDIAADSIAVAAVECVVVVVDIAYLAYLVADLAVVDSMRPWHKDCSKKDWD